MKIVYMCNIKRIFTISTILYYKAHMHLAIDINQVNNLLIIYIAYKD